LGIGIAQIEFFGSFAIEQYDDVASELVRGYCKAKAWIVESGASTIDLNPET
jgi:hypothetical protein